MRRRLRLRVPETVRAALAPLGGLDDDEMDRLYKALSNGALTLEPEQLAENIEKARSSRSKTTHTALSTPYSLRPTP